MSARRDQSMPLNQRIKIVPWRVRKQGPRKFHCAQDTGPKINATSLELILQKTVIEAGIVRDEELSSQPINQIPGDCFKRRRIRYHLIGDASKPRDEIRNPRLRMNQLVKSLHATG